MNYNEHNPPHFHAEYQGYEAIVDIKTGAVSGTMPRRALKLIWDWLDEHQVELLANWEQAREHQPLNSIDPLP
jgi:hypothetical protein